MTRTFRTALALITLLTAAPTLAGAATITLNFKDTDIREVATSIGEITGHNFVFDPTFKGVKVTVVSARPIPQESVYPVFLSVLQLHGFSAVPAGPVVKIVKQVDATRTPGRTSAGGAPPDEVVTQVIELRSASANQLMNALRPLLGLNAHLQAVPSANALVIVDTAASIARLNAIIERVDQASEGDVELVTLAHASAGEVVRVLTSLAQAQPKDGATPAPAIVADERTNSVLIGGSKADRLRLKALVAHLDTPRETDGNTQVVYLRYANAENLAKILQGYAGQSRGGSSAPATAGASAPVASPLDGVSVLAETETNALVITAAPRQMQAVRNIVEKLDIRRAQVLVEAIIVEMSADRAAEMGITWAVDATESKAAAGFTNFSRVGPGVIQLGAAAQGGTAALNLIPDGVTLGVGRIQAGGVSFAALARALAGTGDTNILSTPSLLTLDNEEAEFSAGQEVPFLTGQYSNTGTGGSTPTNPFQTIERKDIGVKLKIKPQINEGNAVFLNIQQEVSSLGTSAVATVDAVTNKRTISTRVLVNDGEIIVLGGLTDDQLQQSEQRVPVLGAIPGLGALFRYRKTVSAKRTLTVFLRPHIMHDGVDASRFTESKYREVRDLQLQQGKQREVPTLPPLAEPAATPATGPATAPPAGTDERG